MRIGQEVRYIGTDDSSRYSVLTGFSGVGQSGAKRLDLRVKLGDAMEELTDIPHEADAEPGEAFWLLPGERRKPRPVAEVDEAEEAPEEVAEESADEEPKGKAPTKRRSSH